MSEPEKPATVPSVDSFVSTRPDPRNDLWGGKSCNVPKDVAICPECSGGLHVYCHQWNAETGQPDAEGLQVDCDNEKYFDDDDDPGHEHHWFQQDWQDVIATIRRWAYTDSSC